MKKRFTVELLEEARDFLGKLDEKTRKKILKNFDRAAILNDPKLFKKLTADIWEFRTLYSKKQYRLLAFWNKTDETETLVIATHGFLKKTDKVPLSEIEKAENLRKSYFS